MTFWKMRRQGVAFRVDEIKGFQLPQLFSRKFHCVEPRLVHEFEAPLGINALGHFLGVLDAITKGLFTVFQLFGGAPDADSHEFQQHYRQERR